MGERLLRICECWKHCFDCLRHPLHQHREEWRNYRNFCRRWVRLTSFIIPARPILANLLRYWAISTAEIKKQVASGRRTLVTIQFGHNDQKIATPESMGANLTAMVQQVRALGAEPVLVTSLTRRSFSSNGKVSDTLGPWADRESVLRIRWNKYSQ